MRQSASFPLPYFRAVPHIKDPSHSDDHMYPQIEVTFCLVHDDYVYIRTGVF